MDQNNGTVDQSPNSYSNKLSLDNVFEGSNGDAPDPDEELNCDHMFEYLPDNNFHENDSQGLIIDFNSSPVADFNQSIILPDDLNIDLNDEM